MKKTLLTIAAVVSCAAIMASCGGNTANSVTDTTNTTAAITSAASVTTVATTEPTTAQLTSAATSNLEKKNETTSTAKTTVAKTTVKKAAATTKKSAPKTTAKKTAEKTTKKAAQKNTTKKQVGLTKADYEWVAQKGNEYISTLPYAFLQPDAQGYTFEHIYPRDSENTKEKFLTGLKGTINCEYEDFLNSDGSLDEINGVGMYVSVGSGADGYYLALRYAILL